MNNNILQISFDASTINGNIVKNMTYTPVMSQPQLYNSFSNILFIPTIKLTRAIFGKSMGLFDRDLGDDDIKKIFKYPNYCNLDNSKKQVSQYIKLMCKDLSIPIKKKVRSVQIGNKRTSNRAIFMIELEDI